jgi:hypothetical protein
MISELETLRKTTFDETEMMKARAYEESRKVREGADQYAEMILTSLDKSLIEFQTVVRNGQNHLKRTRLEAHQQVQQYSLPPLMTQNPQQAPHQPTKGRMPSSAAQHANRHANNKRHPEILRRPRVPV